MGKDNVYKETQKYVKNGQMCNYPTCEITLKSPSVLLLTPRNPESAEKIDTALYMLDIGYKTERIACKYINLSDSDNAQEPIHIEGDLTQALYDLAYVGVISQKLYKQVTSSLPKGNDPETAANPLIEDDKLKTAINAQIMANCNIL